MQISGIPAIVTGGGSGLGAATAKALAAKGAKVSVLDLNLDSATAVARDIGGQAFACDVSQESAAEAIDKAAQKHGVARILVNCAGIGPAGKTFSKNGPLSLGEYTKVISVNLIGTFNMLRLSAARMMTLDLIGEERGII